MEADALYINVYKHDIRHSKALHPANENFVCFVDYNKSGTTTLVHGGIFKNLGISYTMRKQDFLVLLGERKICNTKNCKNFRQRTLSMRERKEIQKMLSRKEYL